MRGCREQEWGRGVGSLRNTDAAKNLEVDVFVLDRRSEELKNSEVRQSRLWSNYAPSHSRGSPDSKCRRACNPRTAARTTGCCPARIADGQSQYKAQIDGSANWKRTRCPSIPGMSFSLLRAGIATTSSTMKLTNESVHAVIASKIVKMPDFCSAKIRDSSEPSCFGFRMREKMQAAAAIVAADKSRPSQPPVRNLLRRYRLTHRQREASR